MGNSLIWVIRIIFIVFSTPEDGTDRLSRNVCKKLQLFTVLYNPEDGSSVTRTSFPHANYSHLETTKYLINRGPVWKGGKIPPHHRDSNLREYIFHNAITCRFV